MDQDVQDYLSGEFWQGKRWVVGGAGLGDVDMKCFYGFQDASEYCDGINTLGKAYRVYLLSTVLKSRKGVVMDQSQAAGRQRIVYELISAAPFFLWGDKLAGLTELSADRFWPIYWRLYINPLTDVDSFRIVGCRHNNKRLKSIGSFSHWEEALSSFRRLQANGQSLAAALLIGEHANGTLVFYQFSSDTGAIVQVNDPCTVIPVNNGLFARIHFSRKQVQFYDGYLSRVQPRSSGLGLDFSWFAHFKG